VSCQVLIVAVAAVAAILPGPAGVGPAPAPGSQQPDLAAYGRGIAAAVRSDLAASVRLPDGGQVYVFGDTVAVNGQVICGPSRCPDGYPHDSMAIQRPYFWMVAPAVEGNSLYVIGSASAGRAARSRVRTRLVLRSAPATPSPTGASPRSPARPAIPSGGQLRPTRTAAGGG
jgi:hypothetical protein